MSGGAFDYQQYHIGEIADRIEAELSDPEAASQMRAETIEQFSEAVRVLRRAEVYAQRIDWLLSGDDGEDTFHSRLAEDLAALEAKR